MDQALTPRDASAPSVTNPMIPKVEVDLTGKTLGDFQVLRRLGQGGMGQVYLAEQISLKRKVALKLLRPELAGNDISLKRFKAEAEAIARATHANIVQVYAIGDHGGLHYMALEFVEGRNLREFLEKKGPPEILLGLSIMRQVAAALERAGELGIIHRDIKPENILLTRKGEVKVTDFGLIREAIEPLNLTQTGITMGTPLYMSPEQVEGKAIDPRTDIYSFGVTCYHMFAGHPPFRGTSPFDVAFQHVQKEAQPLQEIRPDLPLELCAIIHKMMAKKPESRHQTGREIVRDVAQLRDAVVGVSMNIGPANVSQAVGDSSLAMTAARETQAEAAPLPKRRWLVGATLLVALVGGLTLGWWRNHTTPAAIIDEPDPKLQAALLQKQKEQKLLQEIQEHSQSKKLRETKDGLDRATELTGIYFKDKRWNEAEVFYKELEKLERPYPQFAKLGKAMVLAHQDEAKASNKLFEEMLGEKPGKSSAGLQIYMKNSGTLRELVAEALRRNSVNSPDMAPRLKFFLSPPAPTLKGTGEK
ncbi:MAG: serine/threonine protein kinase [Planctomycetes bacterium]|nr:serine/threonine protein kinase [Planctomycetota bacterium]